MGKFEGAWRRLAKDCEVRLHFHDEVEGKADLSEAWYIARLHFMR
jgi:hypothetical protein